MQKTCLGPVVVIVQYHWILMQWIHNVSNSTSGKFFRSNFRNRQVKYTYVTLLQTIVNELNVRTLITSTPMLSKVCNKAICLTNIMFFVCRTLNIINDISFSGGFHFVFCQPKHYHYPYFVRNDKILHFNDDNKVPPFFPK